MAKEKTVLLENFQQWKLWESSNVICSDKTGTLTQNRMKVVEVQSFDERRTLAYSALCTDCSIMKDDNVIGEPTEKALVEKALEVGEKIREFLEGQMKRVSEVSF